MPRSLWTGTISFGLVNVPIRLVTAVRDKSIHFNLLSEDGSCRLRRKLYCPDTGEEYDFKQTARGYEIAPGQYVIIRDEELERLKPEAGRTMEIRDFVPLKTIDPLYFDKSYYLLPGEGGAKGYQLLVDAMASSQMVGIARFVMREREHLVALRVYDKLLAVHTLHYAAEVQTIAEVGDDLPGEQQISKKEIDVARKLIDVMASEAFDPSTYRDEYTDKVRELIEAKAENKDVTVAATQAQEEAPQTYNIMDALKKSLEQRDRGGKSGRKKPTKRSA